MIVTDRPQEVAGFLLQVDTHDGTGGGDVEARLVDETMTYHTFRQVGVLRQWRDPARIDLDRKSVV